MKTVHDLSPQQMEELKQDYLTQHLLETEHRDPSYGELADAENLVADWLIFDAYKDTLFTDEDFWCSACESADISDIGRKPSLDAQIENASSQIREEASDNDKLKPSHQR